MAQNKIIYVDNNATTMVAPEVRDVIIPFLGDKYGNPSSMYSFAGEIAKYVDDARQSVANLLGANREEIVFTSCGTESDNAAIIGVLEAFPEKRHIVTTRVEHPAVLNLFKHIERKGYDATYLRVDSKGNLDPDELRQSMRKDTAIVSIMLANNETGNLFPIEELGCIVKEFNSILHVDAVQAAAKIPMKLSSSTIDLLSISGHKFHAPKGVGVLYIKRGTKIRPFIIGGHQERGRRAGTENVPYIAGIGKAADLALQNMDSENDAVTKMRDYLEKRIIEEVPGASVNGDPDNRLPNTSNISFEFVEGEAILLMLDRGGICASSGSACTSGSLEPSHVLRAMGIPFTKAHGSIRFSLSRYNKIEEMDIIVDVLKPAIIKLREMSPGIKHMVK